MVTTPPRGPSAVLATSRYEFAAQTLRRLAPELPERIVFEIGAGDGRMKVLVESAGLMWRGFDLVAELPMITAWDLSAPYPRPEEKAGAVLLLDVIEHLANPGVALSHIADVLLPGGWLIMTMPNPRWGRSRIHALMHGVPACFTQSDLDLNGHVFTPWPHIVIRLLTDADFDPVDYVTLDGRTRWPGGPLSLRYPLRCSHAAANLLIERLDPSACGMSYALLARQREKGKRPRWC